MKNRIGEERVNNFGSTMIIVEYNTSMNMTIYFPQYNYMKEGVAYKEFLLGKVKCPYEPRIFNKGYIGEGIYSCSNHQEMYAVWRGLFQRCYNQKNFHKQPTYSNCQVDEQWYNFQNFAQWYEENYYKVKNEEMHLDKDILNKGNKIYSPNNCIFVPERINTLFVKNTKRRGALPIGVYEQNGKYIAQLSTHIDGKRVKRSLGSYYTPQSAFNAYKQAKELYIKEVADEYKDYIPLKLYEAMYMYEVEFND